MSEKIHRVKRGKTFTLRNLACIDFLRSEFILESILYLCKAYTDHLKYGNKIASFSFRAVSNFIFFCQLGVLPHSAHTRGKTPFLMGQNVYGGRFTPQSVICYLSGLQFSIWVTTVSNQINNTQYARPVSSIGPVTHYCLHLSSTRPSPHPML